MYYSFLFGTPRRLFVMFLSLFIIGLILAPVSIPARAQGFGRLKMDVRLYEFNPPRILLEGTEFQVEISTQRGVSRNYLDQLKQGIENRLPLSDRRLRPVSSNPETIINCEITHLGSSSFPETRYTSVYKKTGERTEYDETTKTSRTVDDYGYVNEPHTVTVVSGHLSLLYECRDAKTGKLIDSDTITSGYHQEHTNGFGGGYGEAEYHMIENAVYHIAARFGPYFAPFDLLLPKGKLKNASESLKKRMWNSALEKLSAIREMKDPEKDAFRLYSIALAYHGLSNDWPDADSSRHYMEKAVQYYKEARRKNPSEESFRQAESIAEESLAGYRKVRAFMLAYEAKQKQKGAAVAGAQTPAQRAAAGPAAITNDTVIGWVKTGASEKEIRSRIKRAKVKGFDLSSDNVSTLLASGVSPRTVDEMRISMSTKHSVRKPGSLFALALVYLLTAVPYIF